MNACSRRTAAVGAVATLAGLACHRWASGAAPAVEAFEADTWKRLQAETRTPAIVVFSATWCPNCPAVLDDLARDRRRQRLKAPLLAVIMDVPPGESDAALLRDAHYRQADRLLAFSGPAPALRYSVDPRWRGATPFVALLMPGRPPRTITGPPSSADLDAWVASASRGG